MWTKGLKENLAKFSSEHREAILKIIGKVILYKSCGDLSLLVKYTTDKFGPAIVIQKNLNFIQHHIHMPILLI